MLRATSILKCAFYGAAVLLLDGCKPAIPENYYAVPAPVAYERLTHADITGFRDARQCGMLISFSATQDPPRAITWTVSSGGVSLVYFTLRVTPSGQGSLITIEIPKAADGGEFYDAEQSYKHPALMQPLRSSLRELVDAAIAQRGYDWRKIVPPVNSGGICGSLRQNFQASGIPYDINDPPEMTHDQAEELRRSGTYIAAEPDPRPAGSGANPWAK